MTASEPARARATELVALYDEALPHVYGYLVARCRSAAVAEDLTAETFLALVKQADDLPAEPTVAYAMGVARHKLVDHWRREDRQRRTVELVHDDPDPDDPWDVQLDVMRARETLSRLPTDQRVALTLRYVDDLSVPDVAAGMGRSVPAAESMLVRARAAFRRAYGAEGSD